MIDEANAFIKGNTAAESLTADENDMDLLNECKLSMISCNLVKNLESVYFGRKLFAVLSCFGKVFYIPDLIAIILVIGIKDGGCSVEPVAARY